MWHELDDHVLPSGVITVDARVARILLGAKTVEAWKLDRFRTATPLVNSTPGLVTFQLYEDNRGKRTMLGGGSRTRAVNCQAYLKHAGAKAGRYLARQEKDGLIVVDFGTALPQGWRPQNERYSK